MRLVEDHDAVGLYDERGFDPEEKVVLVPDWRVLAESLETKFKPRGQVDRLFPTVDATLLFGHERGDATHDRIGDRLRVVRLDNKVRRSERFPHADEDVAPPERSEPRALGPHNCEREKGRTRTLCDIGNAGMSADQLPRFAAMSLREKAERLARRDHVERHPQRAAVGLAPPDRERADSAQEEADDRGLEELALAHVADGVTKREL